MPDIRLVDVSIRDGNQSLWGATALNTAQMLTAAPMLERSGLRALDFMSSTHMGIAVRTFQEDPWHCIRLMKKAMPTTPAASLLLVPRVGDEAAAGAVGGHGREVAHGSLQSLEEDEHVGGGLERESLAVGGRGRSGLQ